MLQEEATEAARRERTEAQLRMGTRGLDAGIERSEGCEDETRAPLDYEEAIPDLWLEANKFVDALYLVNRAVRSWWAKHKAGADDARNGKGKEGKEPISCEEPKKARSARAQVGEVAARAQVGEVAAWAQVGEAAAWADVENARGASDSQGPSGSNSDGYHSLMQTLASRSAAGEHEAPKQLAARAMQVEQKRRREGGLVLSTKKARQVPDLFAERLKEKGLR